MNGYILVHNETLQYVTWPGSEHSYTKKLEDARVFANADAAQKERCVESETVVAIRDLFRKS